MIHSFKKISVKLGAVIAMLGLGIALLAGEPSVSTGYDISEVQHLGDSNELVWSRWLATQMGLEPEKACEVKTFDGSRVDILTLEFAYEVEWSHKWKEAIGQSVLYGIETNRRPGIILLSRGKDMKYLHRCQIVCTKLNIHLRVQEVPEKATP